MTVIKETQQIISKYAIDGTATLQLDLTKNQLLELKEKLEELHKEIGYMYLQGQRKSDCYLWEVNKRLDEVNKITQKTYKYNFNFDNLKIETEKPIEPSAYNEPVFIPNETEADINISTSELTNEELNELEMLNFEREQTERKRELDEINWELKKDENIDWGEIGREQINKTKKEKTDHEARLKELEKLIANLSLRVKELENKNCECQQVAQILQSPK